MRPTLPEPIAVKTSRPTVAVLAAGLVGALVGGLGGVTIASPARAAADVDLHVHHLALAVQPDGGATAVAYSTTIRTTADGGRRARDNGGTTCPTGAATSKLLAGLSWCADGGWLHVVELALAADGGVKVEAYASHLGDDGGRVDDGRVPCEVVGQDVADVIFGEAVACVESAVED